MMGPDRSTDPPRWIPAAGSGVGVVVGVIVMLGFWILDLRTEQLGLTPASVWFIHLQSPAHFLVDTSPILLGWLGWLQFKTLTARPAPPFPAAGGPGWSAQLAHAMIDGVFIVSRDGVVEEVNPGAGRIFGYQVGDMRGQPIRTYIPDHDQHKGKLRFRTTASNEVLGATWHMNGRHRDGSTFPIELSYAPTADQRFVYVVRDATERVRVEDELKRKLASAERKPKDRPPEPAAPPTDPAVSSFYANLTFQVRGPLSEIIGYTEVLLGRNTIADENAKVIRSISRSARELLGLVNNVLDYQKLEAGRMSILLEPVHIPRLVLEVENAARDLVEEHENELEVLLDPMVASVRSDASRLKQVLMNLLSNAARFTTGGTVRLEAGFHDDEADGSRWVALRVRDTGIGMQPDLLERLLDSESLERAAREGRGMGMAIIREMSSLIGGRLEAASTPGEGTVFTVLLPTPYRAGEAPPEGETDPGSMAGLTFNAPHVEPAPDGEADEVPDQDETTDERKRKKRRHLLGGDLPGTLVAGASRGEGEIEDDKAPLVLLIDDEPPALRELVIRHLDQNGFRIAVATTGNDGLHLAHEERPAVILLEVMVADRDGWEVLEVLKAEGDLRNIPVIVASIVDDETRAISMGADACLPKPIDRNRLLAAVKRSLREVPVVMVVDSDDQMRGHVARALGLAGWRVAECNGAVEALEALTQSSPAVIVLDPALSDMVDTEFLTTIRNHPVWKTIPLVAFSVPKDDEVVRRYNEWVNAVVTEGDADRSTSLIGHAVATLLAPKDQA